ncbi:hypothetical protein ACM64Y_04460 [Novispirillum sp. DQ9]|uniref:hypothetical protein n=1 Tax=Novispirillum sp. DQ9 TaxID=3398612 RepID=UPI003C7DE539
MPHPTSHTSPPPLDPAHAVKVLHTIVRMTMTMEVDLRRVGLMEEAHLVGTVRASAEQRLESLSADGHP